MRAVLYTVGAIVLASILLFLAATRTKVGHDALRHQLEAQFASTYHGTLEIGALRGNLRRQVFLSDVRIFDSKGHLWLSVDSVTSTPRWTALISWRFETGTITMLRPSLMIHHDSARVWRFPDPLRRRNPSAGSVWKLESADLVVQQGSVTGILQDTGGNGSWLNDVFQLQIDEVNALATIGWDSTRKVISVEAQEAQVAGKDLYLHDAYITVVVEGDSVLVQQADMRLGSSHISGNGSVTGSVRAGDLAWKLSLDKGSLDFGELQRLIPKLPLSTTALVSGHIRGTASDAKVESLALVWGASQVLASGTVSGWPDSIAFAMDLAPSAVHPRDIAHVRSQAFPAWITESDIATVESHATGMITRDTMTLDARAQGQALGGTYALAAALGRSPHTGWTYHADIRGNALELPPEGTRLSGTAQLQGTGTALESHETTLHGTLGSSLIAGLAVDSLSLDLTVEEQQARLFAQARQAQSAVDLAASADWSAASVRYAASIRADSLDLGPLLGQDSLESAVTGSLDARGLGLEWGAIQGALSIHIDEAQLRSSSDTLSLPRHSVTATMHSAGGDMRLMIDGDLLSASLRGKVEPQAVRSLADLWTTATRNAVARQSGRLYANPGYHAELPRAAWPPPELISQQQEAGAALLAASLDHISLDLDIQVKHPDWVSTWLSWSPSVSRAILHRRGGIKAAVHLRAGTEDLALDLAVSDNTDSSSASLALSAGLQAPLEETLDLTVVARAPHVEHWGIALADPHATLRVQHAAAHLSIAGGPDKHIGPVALDATASLLDDRYRVTLNRGLITVHDQLWQLAAGQAVDIFWDAVAVDELSVVQTGTTPQRIRVSGLLSRNSGRHASAELEGLNLAELSRVLNSRRTLGGYLDGTVQWSDETGWTGHATVDTLSLGGRAVGRLTAHSHLNPGMPDVDVDAAIHPLRQGATLSPDVKDNDIVITGTMRPKTKADDGNLNLAVDVGRLDAFFLEEIIPSIDGVEGSFTGSGTVTGTLQYPIFEASLDLADARFKVPSYNLAFEADGSVSVDEQGIHIKGLAITDSTGGSAAVDGTLLFNNYQYFSFDVAGRLEELQIMNVSAFTRDQSWYGTVWTSGDVTLTGPLDGASLHSNNVVTSPKSELYIPIRESTGAIDPGFIIYSDPYDTLAAAVSRRTNILARRPATERQFGAGLDMDLNIEAPEGSTIKLVIDPLLGDIITGTGTARIQLQLREGDMATYGTFNTTAGDYLFTAGDVFVRRFLISEGTIQWTGDPLDPTLDIQAEYRTRASRSGLPADIGGTLQTSLPLIVDLHLSGELNAVQVDLSLSLDQRQEAISDTPLLEAYLNQTDRAAQHASSVLLTNSFLLSAEGTRNDVLAGSALNSVSQLVTSQLNRYLSHVIPNADFALGVSSDEAVEDLDISAGIALSLLDERLLIRGHGIYRGQQIDQPGAQGLEGEFIVEIQLSPTVSADLFYRREGDVLSETLIISETGVGLNYRTQFSTWRGLWDRVFKTGGDKPDTLDVQ